MKLQGLQNRDSAIPRPIDEHIWKGVLLGLVISPIMATLWVSLANKVDDILQIQQSISKQVHHDTSKSLQ